METCSLGPGASDDEPLPRRVPGRPWTARAEARHAAARHVRQVRLHYRVVRDRRPVPRVRRVRRQARLRHELDHDAEEAAPLRGARRAPFKVSAPFRASKKLSSIKSSKRSAALGAHCGCTSMVTGRTSPLLILTWSVTQKTPSSLGAKGLRRVLGRAADRAQN